MKLLLKCVVASFVFCAFIGLVAALSFNGPLAMLGWPGLLIVNAVYARFGFYVRDFASMLPWLVPGLLLDVILYALLFWVLSVAWRVFAKHRPSP